ncbi:MAG: hypothetical protein IJJ74_02100 [Eubacterium sp.]|nr:hypothetical protein [Eubacterium sp.]
MKKNIPNDEELKKYIHKKMTLPLMEHASEEVKESVWKLVKRLSTYARVPGTVSDFKKMAVFAEDDAIVDVVLDTLKDMKYPFKNTDFIPDIAGYYYCIALVSQSMHRRDETIKLFNEIVDHAIAIQSDSALPLARNMDVMSKEYPDLTDIFEKARIIYKIDAINTVTDWVRIEINKLYPDYTSVEKIEAEYINIKNPQDGRVFVEVDENEYVVRIVEKEKDIFNKKFKHYSYEMIIYAIVRDVLLRKHMEDLQIDDSKDTRVVEAMKSDMQKLYGEIAIKVNNKELNYILDWYERYDHTNLPQDVRDYLAEIYNDEDLKDAFYNADIEIYDEKWVKDLEDDDSWFEELMGPGESTYENIKPFAREGAGGMWVVLNDELIGYIGSEGECGIVARSIHEFMNIVSVWGGYLDEYWDEDVLESSESFYETMNDSDRLEDYDDIKRDKRVFKKFIKKHGFTTKIYDMAVKGMKVTPSFVVKATDDEYVDSEPLI